jgi:predicted metal-dependent peptidase
MIIKNIHEKLLNSVQRLLIDTTIDLPYYGEFSLYVNFHEQPNIETCGVNVSTNGMNFYYSPKFLDRLSQKEVNFVNLHEDFHLIFDHPKRTTTGLYNHKLANIAQDMIINHIIWEDISHSFVEIPKGEDGKNMALFIPKEYTGKLIFEELYGWLRDEKEKWEKEKAKNESGGSEDSSNESKDNQNGDKQGDSGDSSYGPWGKDPSGKTNGIDTWSKEQIFKDLESGTGEYLDKHMSDDVSEEMRDSVVKNLMDILSSRGLSSGDIDRTLNKLRKKRKDYLREIKKSVSNMIFGSTKQKTIVKPNRRQIPGLKGNRKVKTKINVILDTSGSMGGQSTFEKVLSYVYRNDIEINFIESDTNIKWVETIKSTKRLQSLPIKGLGGTIMQTGINYVVQNFNQFNTVLLTDGWTDSLDLSKLRGKLLIISVGVNVPISVSNGKVKQIIVDNSDK